MIHALRQAAGRTRCPSFLFAALLAATGCKAPERPFTATPDYARPLEPGEAALVKVPRRSWPDFSAGFHHTADLVRAVDRSLDYMRKPSSKRWFPKEGITHERVFRSLEAFRALLVESWNAEEFARRLGERFEVYRSTGWDRKGTVLFTGYCEPVVEGSRFRTDRFRYPLYRLPPDLVKTPEGKILGRRTAAGKCVPYYTRREIDEGGVLEGRGLELVWLADPLDAYIVHVQGSATVRLPDGKELKAGYAGKNGRPYRSLGRILVEEGKIPADRLSLQAIRAWFRAHPGALWDTLFRNPSYVFFTENEGGPYGSLGVEVTPFHTIATDKSVFPRAAPVFLDTRLPVRTPTGGVRLARFRGFALDQDTGGAIRSAGRVDVFMGTGRDAEELAGRTRSEGKLYYLFLREDCLAGAARYD